MDDCEICRRPAKNPGDAGAAIHSVVALEPECARDHSVWTEWPGIAVFVLSATYLLLRAPDPLFLLKSNDQGYQMALGMTLATGRLPCLDVLPQYGPLVAVASWFGFILTGSAVGELCIDAVGYAAAIALAHRILHRHGHRTIAVIVAISLLTLFPRFYKWYYWLLPLLGMTMAERFRTAVAANHPTAVVLAVWGGLVGTAWLFRYDLGLEGAAFGLLAIFAAQWSVFPGQRPRLRTRFAAGSGFS